MNNFNNIGDCSSSQFDNSIYSARFFIGFFELSAEIEDVKAQYISSISLKVNSSFKDIDAVISATLSFISKLNFFISSYIK